MSPDGPLSNIELALVEGYRAGMKNGIREYAVWHDGGQYVGVERRPLADILAAVDAVTDAEILRCALSAQTRVYLRYLEGSPTKANR